MKCIKCGKPTETDGAIVCLKCCGEYEDHAMEQRAIADAAHSDSDDVLKVLARLLYDNHELKAQRDDLLAACEAMVARMDNPYLSPADMTGCDESEQGRAAIAKAKKGGS